MMIKKGIIAACLSFLGAVALAAPPSDVSEDQISASAQAVRDAWKSSSAGAPAVVRAQNASAQVRTSGKYGWPVTFMSIKGGGFIMGAFGGDGAAKPLHMVRLADFEMSKTAVTAGQYAECVDQGRCAPPDAGPLCNWGDARRSYPVNCVSHKDALDYAAFKGARLPTEAEYEYAATSQWRGRGTVSCEVATYADGETSCRSAPDQPVCSNPQGITQQGLCDMTGSIWEWTQDAWHGSFQGASADGSAAAGPSSGWVLRGGLPDPTVRIEGREIDGPAYRYAGVGFRIAKSVP